MLLFAGIVAYIVFAIRQSRKESGPVQAEYNREFGVERRMGLAGALLNVAFVIAGMALLVLGARWLVNGAVSIARSLGLSELIIGLTIIAVGTSLPEVATSVIASIRGDRDIAVGNVVGSCICNIVSVLGISSLVSREGILVSAQALQFDIPVMIGVAVACLPVFYTGDTISRWEGALFLGYYVAYTVYLILHATGNGALPMFHDAMLWFVIPLTGIALIVHSCYCLRRSRAERERISSISRGETPISGLSTPATSAALSISWGFAKRE